MLSWSYVLLLLRREVVRPGCSTSTLAGLNRKRGRVCGTDFSFKGLLFDGAMTRRYLSRLLGRGFAYERLLINGWRFLKWGTRFGRRFGGRWGRLLTLRVWGRHVISLGLIGTDDYFGALRSAGRGRCLFFTHQNSNFAEVWRVEPIHEFFLTDPPIPIGVSHSKGFKCHWDGSALIRRREKPRDKELHISQHQIILALLSHLVKHLLHLIRLGRASEGWLTRWSFVAHEGWLEVSIEEHIEAFLHFPSVDHSVSIPVEQKEQVLNWLDVLGHSGSVISTHGETNLKADLESLTSEPISSHVGQHSPLFWFPTYLDFFLAALLDPQLLSDWIEVKAGILLVRRRSLVLPKGRELVLRALSRRLQTAVEFSGREALVALAARYLRAAVLNLGVKMDQVLNQGFSVAVDFVDLKSGDDFVVVERVDLVLHGFDEGRLEIVSEAVHGIKSHSLVCSNLSSRRVLWKRRPTLRG